MNLQNKSEYKNIIKLGTPIVVGQLGMTIQGLADTMMLGFYSTEGLAAVGLINSIIMMCTIFVMGFSFGLVPLCGAACGRGDTDGIASLLKNSMWATSLVALVLMAIQAWFVVRIDLFHQPQEIIPYINDYFWIVFPSFIITTWMYVFKNFFDSIMCTKVSMVATLTGNIWNIIFNGFLIFGTCGFPELGVKGAAIATATSRIVMVAIFLYVLAFHSKYDVYRKALRKATFQWKWFKMLNKTGFPISIQMGMEASSFQLCSIFVGWIGANALATHQITLNISTTIWVMYCGIASAVSVRISNFVGMNDKAAIRLSGFCGMRIILVMAVFLSMGFFFMGKQIAGFFTNDPAIVSTFSTLILPICLYQFGDGLQTIFSNALRGLGRVKYVVFDSFVAFFVVSLPLSYFLGITLNWGLYGIWMAFPFGLSLAAVLYGIRFYRYSR